MIGDVWLEEDSDGKVFLCIGIGNEQVSKKEIKKGSLLLKLNIYGMD